MDDALSVILAIFVFLALVLSLILYRRVACGNIPVISPICRFCWNMSCLIGSYIPFIGWICAKWMIVENEEEAMAQKTALENSELADEIGAEWAAQSESRLREEQRSIEKQAERERRISAATGGAAVRIHGNQVDIGKKTYDLNEVERDLKIQ